MIYNVSHIGIKLPSYCVHVLDVSIKVTILLIALRSSPPYRHTATMTTDPSAYVTLISSDGFEFIVRRECAYHSKTIKTMLDPSSKSQILWSSQ